MSAGTSAVRARFFSLSAAFLVSLVSAFPALAKPEPASPPDYDFRVEEVWIPMDDGVRLAANLYMPTGGKPGEKFPVLLESMPYRKGDESLAWGEEGDYERRTYFARRGYVGLRVDVRGTGNSEGDVPYREYSEREQRDTVEVIAWLARQPWSNGNVGMFGDSWSGMSTIQVAGRQPPALKAIFVQNATEDLFHNDTHYLDGMYTFDPTYELWVDVKTMVSPPPDYSALLRDPASISYALEAIVDRWRVSICFARICAARPYESPLSAH